MRNIAIIVLSVILAAAIISGSILYRDYTDTKDTLLISEKNLSDLNEKLTQLNQETSVLQDQVRKNAQALKELESANELISELESAINVKDQRLSEFGETLRTLQGELEEEKKTKEAFWTELVSKNAIITELQERLQGSQSHTLSLKDEISKDQNEIEGLEGKLLALKGEKATAEAKIDQLKSTYEALVSDLKHQIGNQEVTIKRFEEKISVTFIDRVLFEFGRATISPEGDEILQKVGETLKAVKGKKIKVVGHTDDRPIHPDYYFKFPSNWELSAARASAVVRHFQNDTGLEPSNLEAVGRSFYDPVARNETPEGRAHNRRVEIIIAPEIE